MATTLERPHRTDLPLAPDVALNLYTPKDSFAAEVQCKYRITDHASPNFGWHVVLGIAESRLAGRYRSGQSIGVLPEGRFADASFNYAHRAIDQKLRLYSIASPCWGDDWHGRTVSLCVKREIGEDPESGMLEFGEVSNLICDAQPGDTLHIVGPVGRNFLLPDDPLAHNYVFVATGTGVAPFRGMLIELFEQGFRGQVWLIFGVRYAPDLLYDDEFRQLAEQHENFHYHTAVSREHKTAQGKRLYVHHRLEQHEDALLPLLQQPPSMLYVCGIKGMERGIYRWLLERGSNIVALPDGITMSDLRALPPDSKQWTTIERARDKMRLIKETY